MTSNELKPLPSEIKPWDKIDQSRAQFNPSIGQNPGQFGWYEMDGAFYPYRKPTTDELKRNYFFEPSK